MKLLLHFFPLLLPFAVRWAEQAEETILREGSPLTGPHLADAKLMGVNHPEKIKVLMVPQIPLPKNPLLRLAAQATGLVSPHTAGMSLRYGIFIRKDFSTDRNLIAHECVHTGQYERLGGFTPFLSQYLRECLELGYLESPLEQEAMLRSTEIRG